jgi:hypothetical protein
MRATDRTRRFVLIDGYNFGIAIVFPCYSIQCIRVLQKRERERERERKENARDANHGEREKEREKEEVSEKKTQEILPKMPNCFSPSAFKQASKHTQKRNIRYGRPTGTRRIVADGAIIFANFNVLKGNAFFHHDCIATAIVAVFRRCRCVTLVFAIGRMERIIGRDELHNALFRFGLSVPIGQGCGLRPTNFIAQSHDVSIANGGSGDPG